MTHSLSGLKSMIVQRGGISLMCGLTIWSKKEDPTDFASYTADASPTLASLTRNPASSKSSSFAPSFPNFTHRT